MDNIIFIIFKPTKIKPEVTPTGYYIWGSKTGYINAKLFQEYGEHFVKFLRENNIITRENSVGVA